MCVIYVAWDCQPQYRLVLAANRDEFHSRPTTASQFWRGGSVLAGKDEQAGGTWLGVNRQGAVAAVTNYRNPAELAAKPQSRGELAVDYLQGNEPADKAADKLIQTAQNYAGFNLFLGDAQQLYWLSNRSDKSQKITPGVHGVSNALLNSPWPKVKRGKKRMAQILDEGLNADACFDLLADRHVPDDKALPDTGVGLSMERLLGPIFITGAHYGTRASTVLLMSHDGHVEFFERRFGPNGILLGQSEFDFQINA